ncbi:FAD/NAD(P)-binding domain-containing protein [Coprinopsis marcescibilis]|uniref:FAD/NAD(P)-binding domain-containing protein n=1 Tax=Coprinopsis marcescibilis TaxID=230819 RepID=A0A5C3KNK6_COPMA|nr:FAD/NAD(P)-binding domain-containing protein [Coprinopsis marcescibilis]
MKSEAIGVIGAGPAGLIQAHTFLQDGFTNVHIITKDVSVGGVWAKERVYPSMRINNVHGQFLFSSLPMPPPKDADHTGGRLTGYDMNVYFESFFDKFLKDNKHVTTWFKTRVETIGRGKGGSGWDVEVEVEVEDGRKCERKVLHFPRIVLCTGGCSTPKVPPMLSENAARKLGFTGPVVHSSESWSELDRLLKAAGGCRDTRVVAEDDKADLISKNRHPVLIIGGGKSAQDIAAHLSNQNVNVILVYRKADMFLAAKKPVSRRIRQSRLLSVLSPSIELRSRTERFLHNSWLGGKITRAFWERMAATSFQVYDTPEDSPLRLSHNIFWGNRTGDEGVLREDTYQAHVNRGTILKVIAPAYVEGYELPPSEGVEAPSSSASSSSSKTELDPHEDVEGKGKVLHVRLSTGELVRVSGVVLATGYKSSWDGIIDDALQEEIGLTRTLTREGEGDLEVYGNKVWGYASLSNPPVVDKGSSESVGNVKAPGLYKGIVPAKSLFRRDIAVNGAIITANAGYTFELCSHWISSFFLEEPMRLPETLQGATEQTKRNLAWMKKRFPEAKSWMNASYSAGSPHFAWPQAMDDLLEDMYLPSVRSGGSWLTWLVSPISIDELAPLGEERKAKCLTAGGGN